MTEGGIDGSVRSTATRFWQVFHSDRDRYRRTDHVNAWGVLRDRDSGKVPERPRSDGA